MRSGLIMLAAVDRTSERRTRFMYGLCTLRAIVHTMQDMNKSRQSTLALLIFLSLAFYLCQFHETAFKSKSTRRSLEVIKKTTRTKIDARNAREAARTREKERGRERRERAAGTLA